MKSNEALENLKNLNILKRIKEIEQNAKAQIENFVSIIERSEPKAAPKHSKRTSPQANNSSLFPEIEPVIEVVETEAVAVKSKPKIPPPLADVERYAIEIEMERRDAEEFYDYFAANGWRVGGGTGKLMKDWKAAMRNWKRRAPLFASKAMTHAERVAQSLRKTTSEWISQDTNSPPKRPTALNNSTKNV